MSRIQLPGHSAPCHSITVYMGIRYLEEILQDVRDEYLDVSKYENLEDVRFEHSPATPRGEKQPPQYRAIARMDGVWYPFNIEDVENFGLPALPKPEITDPHPVSGSEADGQDGPQPEDVEPAESLTPATDVKKSRTRR